MNALDKKASDLVAGMLADALHRRELIAQNLENAFTRLNGRDEHVGGLLPPEDVQRVLEALTFAEQAMTQQLQPLTLAVEWVEAMRKS